MNPATFPKRLRDALVRITPREPESVDGLRELYADDVAFRDPIQEVHGIEEFIAMNRRLLGRMRALDWTVDRVAGDDETVFLEWRMSGRTKLGMKVNVAGMTRARVRAGRVVDQRDYWDLGELVASPVPGGQRILHALLSPIA